MKVGFRNFLGEDRSPVRREFCIPISERRLSDLGLELSGGNVHDKWQVAEFLAEFHCCVLLFQVQVQLATKQTDGLGGFKNICGNVCKPLRPSFAPESVSVQRAPVPEWTDYGYQGSRSVERKQCTAISRASMAKSNQRGKDSP